MSIADERPGASIDDATVRALADRACVDARSVVRRLAGLPVRGRAGARIDAALEEWRTRASASPPERAA